jgi:hypothetical protein
MCLSHSYIRKYVGHATLRWTDNIFTVKNIYIIVVVIIVENKFLPPWHNKIRIRRKYILLDDSF